MQIRQFSERVALWRYTIPIMAALGGVIASGVGAYLVQQWTHISAIDIIVVTFGFFVMLPIGFTYAYRLQTENRRNRLGWIIIRGGPDDPKTTPRKWRHS